MNVQQTNTNRPPDWNPTPERIAQVLRAVRNEAYPPAGRSGVGSVLRRTA